MIALISDKSNNFVSFQVILSARSDYFSAMLEEHTKEAQEGHVQYKDIDPPVMGSIIRYLYTGQLPPKELAAEVLPVADRFRLEPLVESLQKILRDQITTDNALEM